MIAALVLRHFFDHFNGVMMAGSSGRVARQIDETVTFADRATVWRALEDQRYVEEMGSWLFRFQWSFYATLTSYEPLGLETLMRKYRRWIRWIEQGSMRPVRWFVALETGPAGREHFHALLGNIDHLRVRDLKATWAWVGYAKVERYQPSEGGAFYICKHLTREPAWFDMRLPPVHDQPRPAEWPWKWRGPEHPNFEPPSHATSPLMHASWQG